MAIESPLTDEVDQKLNHFNPNFLAALDSHSSVKTMRIKHRQCPFIDQEIMDLMKETGILKLRA